MHGLISALKSYGFKRSFRVFSEYTTAMVWWIFSASDKNTQISKRLKIAVFAMDRTLEIPAIFSGVTYSRDFIQGDFGNRHPFLHYLQTSKGWNPKTRFDQAYLANRPDVINYDRSPFIHFLKHNRWISYGDLLPITDLSAETAGNECFEISYPEFQGFGSAKNVDLFIGTCQSIKHLNLESLIKIENFDFRMHTQKHSYAECQKFKSSIQIKKIGDSFEINLNIHEDIYISLEVLLGLLSSLCRKSTFSNVDAISMNSAATSLKFDLESCSRFLEGFSTPEVGITESFELALSHAHKLASEKPKLNLLPYKEKRAKIEPTRVLIISHEDKQSGAPLYAAELAKFLESQGKVVKVIVIDDEKPQGVFANLNIDFEPLSRRLKMKNLNVPVHEHWILSPPAQEVLSEILVEFGPNLAVINSLASSCAQSVMSENFIPSIMYVHEIWVKKYPLTGSKDPFLQQVHNALNTTNLSLFGSQASLNAWQIHLNNCNLVSLPSIVDYSRPRNLKKEDLNKVFRNELGIPQDAKVILAIGIFEPRKRIETIVEAFLSRNSENLYLVLLGKAGRFHSYERKLIDLASRSRNILLHSVTRDLDSYYAIADIFVHASEEEVFTLVLQEAASWGVPIIASSYDGVLELLGNEFPYIFEVGNVHSLNKNIDMVLSNGVQAGLISAEVHQNLMKRMLADQIRLLQHIEEVSNMKLFVTKKKVNAR